MRKYNVGELKKISNLRNHFLWSFSIIEIYRYELKHLCLAPHLIQARTLQIIIRIDNIDGMCMQQTKNVTRIYDSINTACFQLFLEPIRDGRGHRNHLRILHIFTYRYSVFVIFSFLLMAIVNYKKVLKNICNHNQKINTSDGKNHSFNKSNNLKIYKKIVKFEVWKIIIYNITIWL